MVGENLLAVLVSSVNFVSTHRDGGIGGGGALSVGLGLDGMNPDNDRVNLLDVGFGVAPLD